MNRITLSVLGMAILHLPSANAAVYKGHRIFVEDCRSCHAHAGSLTRLKTVKGWQTAMKDNGVWLAKVHLSHAGNNKAHRYFSSTKYERESRHLQDFLVEYAKDSGNIVVTD